MLNLLCNWVKLIILFLCIFLILSSSLLQYNHQDFGWLNSIGVVLSLIGILAYNHHRRVAPVNRHVERFRVGNVAARNRMEV